MPPTWETIVKTRSTFEITTAVRLDSTQARRHVLKSGPAEVRASAQGTSEGESTRGVFPLS